MKKIIDKKAGISINIFCFHLEKRNIIFQICNCIEKWSCSLGLKERKLKKHRLERLNNKIVLTFGVINVLQSK